MADPCARGDLHPAHPGNPAPSPAPSTVGPSTFGGRRPRARLGALLTAIALALPSLRAQGGTPPGSQDPQRPPPRMEIDEATDTIAFSMNENNGMQLAEFVKWAQEVTGRAFTFSQQELTAAGQGAEVSFLGTLRIKRERFKEDFFSFFQTMLYIKGFAVVPRGEGSLEMLEIVSMSGPRNREVTNGARYVTPDELEQYRNQTGVPILTTVTLKNINATIATNALRPFFASTGSPAGGGGPTLGNVGNNTAMLIQGFGPQVFAAVKLLELVDVPTEAPNLVVQVVVLEETAPEEIEPILTDVLESRSRIRAAVLQEAGATPAAGAGASQQQNLKVVVHSSQKALVLSGTQEQVREALDLIARLDVPGQPIDGDASVIHLKNVLADELRTTLNTFMTEDNQAETQAAAPTGAGATAARRTRKTVIQAHKESNSLLVSAAGTKWLQIQALIDKLDRRQPQVLIEAALVELTTGDLDRFGVELGLLDIKNDGDFTRGFGFSSFGQSSFTDTNDDGLPDTRLPDFTNPLQGLTGGIISGNDFAVPLLLNALSTDDRANILSLPSVLVNNNETAIVKTEEERPTTTQNQGTATTSSGVGQPRQAGITLEISPTISPNNYLRLNISLEVSRFVGAFDPNSVTGGGVTLRRTIKTQVTMPSDATMVLGGVIEDSESHSDGGIPFLKDIPLLGVLFRRSEDTTNKTNLYFFVTPTILDEDDFQDLWHLSLQKKLEAQDYIGERRLRMIDDRWNGTASQARRLDDKGTTVEDLDAQGEYELPTYRRTPQDSRPAGPAAPTDGAPRR